MITTHQVLTELSTPQDVDAITGLFDRIWDIASEKWSRTDQPRSKLLPEFLKGIDHARRCLDGAFMPVKAYHA